MESRSTPNRLATTSLTLGILGWVLYLLQWCFDLTIGLLMAAFTAGSSTICATVLDFLPFVLWLAAIVTGHASLGQMKQIVAPGRWRAVWGLLLSYIGIFFTIVLIVIIVSLITAGIGVGVLDKIFPDLPRH